MKTIVFELNSTLTESKQLIDPEMAALIGKLLEANNVAIVSGASWEQIQAQVLDRLNLQSNLLSRLYILPTSGAAMYQVWGKYGWVGVYQNILSKKAITDITKSIGRALTETTWEQPDKLWGSQVENRESQITFSGLGQKAPMEKKEEFDPDGSKRRIITNYLQRKLSNYDVRLGGLTSIDISMRGINKKYAIEELIKRLHLSKSDIIYVGGSNYPIVELNLDFVKVSDPEDTKKWISSILNAEINLEKTA